MLFITPKAPADWEAACAVLELMDSTALASDLLALLTTVPEGVHAILLTYMQVRLGHASDEWLRIHTS